MIVGKDTTIDKKTLKGLGWKEVKLGSTNKIEKRTKAIFSRFPLIAYFETNTIQTEDKPREEVNVKIYYNIAHADVQIYPENRRDLATFQRVIKEKGNT